MLGVFWSILIALGLLVIGIFLGIGWCLWAISQLFRPNQ